MPSAELLSWAGDAAIWAGVALVSLLAVRLFLVFLEAWMIFDPAVTARQSGAAPFLPPNCTDDMLPVQIRDKASLSSPLLGSSSYRGFIHLRHIFGPGQGVCFIAHGNNGNIDLYHECDYVAISQRFRVTVVFDYRGYGKSCSETEVRWGALGRWWFRWFCLGERTMTEDFELAWDHVRSLYLSDPITLVGYSMGGGVAISALVHRLDVSQLDNLRRVLLVATFTSVADVAAERVGGWVRCLLRNKFHTERSCKEVAFPCPVIIVVAETDDKFKDPLGMGTRLSAAVYNGGCVESRLLRPAGTDHGNVLSLVDVWWADVEA